mmetsp:Transcript_15512/g.31635  ORF Transcript_15512/g.31635 Transcript_15512/m.31635 type:complete len:110 (+) Transcript_15512:223-552(+)
MSSSPQAPQTQGTAPQPIAPLTESPRDSFIFTLARFVGTLVALSSVTILTIIVLLLKALLITVCEETIGLGGIIVIAVAVAVLFFMGYTKRYEDGGKKLWVGLLGGLDM